MNYIFYNNELFWSFVNKVEYDCLSGRKIDKGITTVSIIMHKAII